MSLSIMHLLIASSSQFAAHPHHHQRQVRRPHQHEGGRQRVRLPPRVVPALPHLLLCLSAGSLPPRLPASRTTWTTTEELQLGNVPSCPHDEVQLVWAKAGRGIWGLGHVFEDKLYFTKDIVDDSFVPKNRKPKPISKPAAKPAPKPAPKGKHVQLFKMKRKVGKGFYSVPVDGQ